MDGLQQKTFTSSRKLTYNYFVTPSAQNANPDLPTLFMLHGWPMNAHLWDHVVPNLQKLPFRMVIPDMIGAGETSKPEDIAAYNSKLIATDLVELLDSEHVGKIILIGHDFGSWFAQRVYLFYRSRVEAVVLLSVPYMPPLPMPITLELFLDMTEKNVGYPQFAYFELLVSPEAPRILQSHVESLYCLIFGAPKGMIRKYYCEKDAFKNYLLADEKGPVKPFAEDPEFKARFMGPLRKYGFDGFQAWYRAMTDNVYFEAEKDLTPEDLAIQVPVLFVGCADDAVARTDGIEGPKSMGLLPDLKVLELDCSHYCPLEKSEEVSDAITGFLKEKGFLKS